MSGYNDLYRAGVVKKEREKAEQARPVAVPHPVAAPASAETGQPVPRVPRPAPAPDAAPEPVPLKDGITGVPNTVLDNLLKTLKPYDQLVYLRLYRLSWGWGETTCEVGVPKIVEATQVPRTQVFQAIKRLEARGLVKRVSVRLDGRLDDRGNTYEITVPGMASPVAVRDALKGRGAAKGRGAGATPDTGAGRNKEIKETHETASVASTLRKIAANYHGDDVRARLRQWFETEGIAVDEALIETALASTA